MFWALGENFQKSENRTSGIPFLIGKSCGIISLDPEGRKNRINWINSFIPQSVDLKDTVQILEQNGFIIMSSEPNRISLNKGYTEKGFADKVYHIHLRYVGDNDELYFRDYLNEHPVVAKEYETLKLRLWKQYEHNRDAYTDAKTDFISRWTAEARKEYGDRYC